MQRGQRGARRPVRGPGRRVPPQPQRQLLGAAGQFPMIAVSVGVDDPQDLQDRVREVGVPAARAEADLPEHLPVPERGERRRRGQKPVERLVVEHRHQPVPDRLDGRDVPVPDRRVHRREVGALLEGLPPRLVDLLIHRGKIFGGTGVVPLPVDVHHGVRRRRGEGVGERPGPHPDQVDVVEQRGRRRREPHRPQLGHRARMTGEARGAHPAAQLLGLEHHRAQAQAHQLVRGDQPGDAAADHRDRCAVHVRRNHAQPVGVAQPAVVAEREVRPEHGDRGRGQDRGHRAPP